MHSSSAPVQQALDPRVMGTHSSVPSSISRGESLSSEYDESLDDEHGESLDDDRLGPEYDESLSPAHDESLAPANDESLDLETSLGGTQDIESDIGRPTKRRKIVRHPDTQQFDMTIQPKLSRLSRQTRWYYFLQFSTEGHDSIIRKVWGHDIAVESFEYSMSRQRILDWCKGWKSKSLEKMNVSLLLLFYSL